MTQKITPNQMTASFIRLENNLLQAAVGFQQLQEIAQQQYQEYQNIYADEIRKLEQVKEWLVEIAQMWEGHAGVDYKTTTIENLVLLIKDAVSYDRERLIGVLIGRLNECT